MRFSGFFRSLAAVLVLGSSVALVQAQDKATEWQHAISVLEPPQLPKDFKSLPYVNPAAPKGGELRLSSEGTFDNLNLLIDRGNLVDGIGVVFDTLMDSSSNEISVSYGLLAESLYVAEDLSYVTFKLRSEATWADGLPVTPEDVIFSFDSAKEHSALYASYYKHVVGVEKTGEREVTFRFDEKNNRELPAIVGDFPILPKHWWQGVDGTGQQRDISRTTLEPLLGSGPYRVASIQPGGKIVYELRDDYWGKDLPINVGRYNFGEISYTYFADPEVEFEAFRAGNIDFYRERSSSRWATRYEFEAVKDGRVKREALPNAFRATGIMQALVPNMRRDIFKDPRVREALNYAFDFEDLNENLAYGGLKRVDSYFWGTYLAASGLPEGREKELLEELRGSVPARVFDTPFTNPVGGDPQKVRENLRKAIGLLREAGWELRGTSLINEKTNQPMTFEILLQSPSFERSVLPYVASLKKIGIDARVRTVDSSQYINRLRSFDYDVIWTVWGQTMNPGNEQFNYWGSEAVDRVGSRNYAGIADPAVDELIRKIVFAPDRDEQIAATRALDRVLLANHYVVPLFYSGEERIAYWDKFDRPAELPTYSIGFPHIWWAKDPG